MALNNLRSIIEKVEKFDVANSTADIITRNAEFIQDLIRIQLSYGKDGDDKKITLFGTRETYSLETISRKDYMEGLAAVTEYVTLYMSGDFYRLLKTTVKGSTFSTTSDVPYFDEIIKMSGEKVVNLSKEGIAFFQKEILIPQLKSIYNGL